MKLKDRCKGVSLGIFAGDLCNLRTEADNAREWGCDILHFDVMDGIFVPQMVGGPGFVQGMSEASLLDVHLMVKNPVDHIDSYVKAGADLISVHIESDNAAAAFTRIKTAAKSAQKEVLAGVSLMPGTDLESSNELLSMDPDVILVLALDPRDGKPANIPQACSRVTEIRRKHPDVKIMFDGGVTLDSIQEICAAGPDAVVSGSAVMRSPDRKQAFEAMRKYCEN